jgi:hypothetical protein
MGENGKLGMCDNGSLCQLVLGTVGSYDSDGSIGHRVFLSLGSYDSR